MCLPEINDVSLLNPIFFALMFKSYDGTHRVRSEPRELQSTRSVCSHNVGADRRLDYRLLLLLFY